MPCHPRKARLLFKEGKAKVVKMVPFTIQLLYGSSGYKQEVSLGVDAGTQHMGVSATSGKHVLFEAEVLPRSDRQALLATRRQFRHQRRQRKTRYRQARYLNRKQPAGWLVPSLRHKVDCHLKTIRLVHNATQMGIMRWSVYEHTRALFANVHLTYGYITRQTIRKGGKRQRNTAPKYVHGFRLFESVRYQGAICFVFGRRSSGYFDLRTLDGTKVSASASCKKLTIVQKATACLVERRAAVPPVP
jgi:hypothetical protein